MTEATTTLTRADSQGQGRVVAETVLTHNRQPGRIIKKIVL